jgi:hypothetical protein
MDVLGSGAEYLVDHAKRQSNLHPCIQMDLWEARRSLQEQRLKVYVLELIQLLQQTPTHQFQDSTIPRILALHRLSQLSQLHGIPLSRRVTICDTLGALRSEVRGLLVAIDAKERARKTPEMERVLDQPTANTTDT